MFIYSKNRGLVISSSDPNIDDLMFTLMEEVDNRNNSIMDEIETLEREEEFLFKLNRL